MRAKTYQDHPIVGFLCGNRMACTPAKAKPRGCTAAVSRCLSLGLGWGEDSTAQKPEPSPQHMHAGCADCFPAWGLA
jgi:hypothetical protein